MLVFRADLRKYHRLVCNNYLEKVSTHHLSRSIPQGIVKARRLPAPVLYQRTNASIVMLPHIID